MTQPAETLLAAFVHLVSEQIMTSWLASAKVWQGAFAVAAGRAEGLALIQQGLDLFDAQGTVAQRPFLLWLFASAGDLVGATARFRRSVAVAQAQQARSLELRARCSLVQVLRSTGGSSDAEQKLADLLGWFTEGFETRDLQQARALVGRTG